MDLLLKQCTDNLSFNFSDKSWSLFEIRHRANVLLGRYEDARSDSERLFNEMQKQYLPPSNAVLESTGLPKKEKPASEEKSF